MAALPPVTRVTKEDLRDAPAWINRLLYPMNTFFNSVYIALRQGLTFQENILSQLYSFRIKAGAAASNNTLKFTLTMKKKPIGMIVVSAVLVSGNYSAIGSAVFAEYTLSGDQVSITSITGLTNGSSYDITVLLI